MSQAKLIQELSLRGYVSLNKFAKIIGVAYPTAVRLVKRGDVLAVRVGGINRVYADEIQRFMEEGNANKTVRAGDKNSPATTPEVE